MVLFYFKRRHDYFDFKGAFYMTLDEDSIPGYLPGSVAVFSPVSGTEVWEKLVLQRGTLHANGRAVYTESLFVDLGDPRDSRSLGPYDWVKNKKGKALCQLDDLKSGGYALCGIAEVPDSLFAKRTGSGDTVVFGLKERLAPYPTPVPGIPWWHEHWLILCHD